MRLLRHISYLGSGGVETVNMPTVIAEAFGCSQGEARRAMQAGGVTVDDEVTELVNIPVDDLDDKQLRVPGRAEAVRLRR